MNANMINCKKAFKKNKLCFSSLDCSRLSVSTTSVILFLSSDHISDSLNFVRIHTGHETLIYRNCKCG